MMESRTILVRRSNPTEFDQLPYGTQCKVSNHHLENYDLYLQVSDNTDEPKWELFGNFSGHEPQEQVDEMIAARLRKNVQYD